MKLIVVATGTILDYHARQRRSWRPSKRAVLISVGVLMFLLVPTASVRQTRSRIDAVTGSMEWQTTWFNLAGTGPRVDVSPLELRLRRMGVTWTRDWWFLHNTHRTLLGNVTCYECGRAPAIYGLRSSLQRFVDAATDDQISAFVQVMRTGTEAQQHAATEQAADVAFTRSRTTP